MAIRVTIEGRVQGVGFRYWVTLEAKRLGVDGWVRNRRDGSVEALISGDPNLVRQMISRCYQGPPISHVTRLTGVEAEDPEVSGFDIGPTTL